MDSSIHTPIDVKPELLNSMYNNQSFRVDKRNTVVKHVSERSNEHVQSTISSGKIKLPPTVQSRVSLHLKSPL